MRPPVRLCLLLALLTAACSTPSTRLSYLAERNVRETTAESGTGGLKASTARGIASRVKEVREFHEKGEIVSAEDHLNAALVLVDSGNLEDLELAKDLALQAAELGEDRGFRAAARAIDRGLLMQGRPQKYGTQFVYEVVLKKWKLYTVDPATTDVEREAMGVEPYLHLLEIERELNMTANLDLVEEAEEGENLFDD